MSVFRQGDSVLLERTVFFLVLHTNFGVLHMLHLRLESTWR